MAPPIRVSAIKNLASFRADIGKDNAFNIENNPFVCFGSGSKSAEGEAARESITCVFIASDSQPFIASVRRKGRIYAVKYDSSGTKQDKEDKGGITTEPAKSARPKEEDPLQVLKLRLAKGEITKEQYEELRKVIDGN